VRLIGCGLLALTFASSGWAAEHYVEVWNPPEARTPAAHAADTHAPDAHATAPDTHAGTAHHTAPAAAKPAAKHKHRGAHAVKARAHRPPVAAAPDSPAAPPAAAPAAQPTAGKLTVMQPPEPGAPHHALDFTDIPRQFTPDGNVLRVGARNRPAEVTK